VKFRRLSSAGRKVRLILKKCGGQKKKKKRFCRLDVRDTARGAPERQQSSKKKEASEQGKKTAAVELSANSSMKGFCLRWRNTGKKRNG